MSADPPPAVILAARGVGGILSVLIIGGAYVSLVWTPGIYLALGGAYVSLVWTPGIYLALGGLTVYFVLQVIAGIVGYRHVMSRLWPRVPPLEDDDDDW